MLKEEIAVGKSYVNERACIVREVVEEVDSRRVRYNAFELENGKLLPGRHRVCGKAELKKWADREAEPDEMDRIHPFEAGAGQQGNAADQGNLRPEEARTATDATAGAHTFPPLK